MNTLRERLALALAKKRGGSQAELAKACRVKQPSVSDWFSGKTQRLKGESLLLAAAYLGVRPEWLQTGRGPMHDDAKPLAVHDQDQAQQWPFQRITAEEWATLSATSRAEVEALATKLLLMTPPHQRTGTTGHSS